MNPSAPSWFDGRPIWNWGVPLGTTALCCGLAGWPAGLLSGVAAVLLLGSPGTAGSRALLAGSIGWILASAGTGDRRLFFAFACWLATLAFMHHRRHRYWVGVLAAIALTTLFFLIRMQQGASGRVLWMELVISATLGGLAVVLESVVPQSAGGHWLVVVSLSLLSALSLFV